MMCCSRIACPRCDLRFFLWGSRWATQIRGLAIISDTELLCDFCYRCSNKRWWSSRLDEEVSRWVACLTSHILQISHIWLHHSRRIRHNVLLCGRLSQRILLPLIIRLFHVLADTTGVRNLFFPWRLTHARNAFDVRRDDTQLLVWRAPLCWPPWNGVRGALISQRNRFRVKESVL